MIRRFAPAVSLQSSLSFLVASSSPAFATRFNSSSGEGGDSSNDNSKRDVSGKIPLGEMPFQSPISLRHKAQRMGDGRRQTNSNEGTGDEKLNTRGDGTASQRKTKSGPGFEAANAEMNAGNKKESSQQQPKKKKPIIYGPAGQQQQRNNEFNDGFTPRGKKSDPNKPTSYKRSREAFKDRAVELKTSFAGAASARDIGYWENIWYNYIRYFVTREALIGKDRYGNRFTVRWFFLRERQEERRCYRVDKDKQHQPYGALPTDSKLWEAWMRKWRYDPPTNEEDEYRRRRSRENLGFHVVGDEEIEDTRMRVLTHTKQASALTKELDNNDEYGKKSIINTEARAKEHNPGQEFDASWSTTVVRGDMFYNEEETEVLRNNLAHMFRDKEWQSLELKRQVRLRKQKKPVRKADTQGLQDIPADIGDGEPMDHQWDRTDSGVPFGNGVSELTTPELEKLRAECDALEEERIALRKELGLTDIGDWREGRPAVDKGYDPFQPPPTSTRWKPKCWSESWGAGGGNLY